MTNDIPLAKDANGQPFDVDPEVVRWQVLRSEGPGRPMPAYDHLGDTICVAVHATHQELFRAAGPGRYRLVPVDATGRALAHLPVAVTGPMQAPPELRNNGRGAGAERAIPEYGDGRVAGTVPALQPSQPLYNDLLSETVRANTRITEAMIAAVPLILNSAGGLLTSADGAKLTTRQPPPWPDVPPAADDDHDDGADEPPEPPPSLGPPAWIASIVQQVAAAVMPVILAKLKISPEALVDWRKAVPSSAPPSPSASPAPAADPSEPPATAPGQGPASEPEAKTTSRHHDDAATAAPAQPVGAVGSPQLTPAALAAHVGLMWQALSPDEQRRAEQRVAALGLDERTTWLVALARLSIADGVARMRAELGDGARTGPGEGVLAAS